MFTSYVNIAHSPHLSVSGRQVDVKDSGKDPSLTVGEYLLKEELWP